MYKNKKTKQKNLTINLLLFTCAKSATEGSIYALPTVKSITRYYNCVYAVLQEYYKKILMVSKYAVIQGVNPLPNG